MELDILVTQVVGLNRTLSIYFKEEKADVVYEIFGIQDMQKIVTKKRILKPKFFDWINFNRYAYAENSELTIDKFLEKRRGLLSNISNSIIRKDLDLSANDLYFIIKHNTLLMMTPYFLIKDITKLLEYYARDTDSNR